MNAQITRLADVSVRLHETFSVITLVDHYGSELDVFTNALTNDEATTLAEAMKSAIWRKQ